MESILGSQTQVNCGHKANEPPRSPGVIPIRILDKLDELKLLAGLRGVQATVSGVVIEFEKGSPLILAIRDHTPAALEFVRAVARAGFTIGAVSLTGVCLSRVKGRA